MGENFMGGGGCSKVCERRMTCPPCMEAAPKLNIIFFSASCLLYTPESHSLHLTSLHKHTSSFWKSFVLHTQQWPRNDLALYTSVLSRC